MPNTGAFVTKFTEEISPTTGQRYYRGWYGDSRIKLLPGEPDEQGRATLLMFLMERRERSLPPLPLYRGEHRET